MHEHRAAVKLFKIHGTIEKDACDGSVSRIIITDPDYDRTTDYRDELLDRLKSDLHGAHLIIIGYSLAGEDMRAIISRAASINSQTMGGARISILVYSRDEDRAFIFQQRGLDVCFGGIDEFFAELVKRIPTASTRPSEGKSAFTPVARSNHDRCQACTIARIERRMAATPSDKEGEEID